MSSTLDLNKEIKIKFQKRKNVQFCHNSSKEVKDTMISKEQKLSDCKGLYSEILVVMNDVSVIQ